MITLGDFAPQLEAYRAKRREELDRAESDRYDDGYVLSNVMPRYKTIIQQAIAQSLALTYKDCWRIACSQWRRCEADYWAWASADMPRDLFAEQPIEPVF